MSTAARPISINAFRQAYDKLWQQSSVFPPRKIGLAISGGSDSMALAHLFINAKPESLESARAFIVDHKLRPESTDEAIEVRDILQRLGLKTSILSNTSQYNIEEHLESAARTIRYRLLGQACQRHGIDTLLLAHHADDQAETVLSRIVGSYFGNGLSGMRGVTQIPECIGMYGVWSSGNPRKLKQRYVDTGYAKWDLQKDESKLSPARPDSMLVESGGVLIARPLLTFTKEEIVATCTGNDVKWFEDKTNADISFTKRNTIRHLQKAEVLPQALRSARMLQLADAVSDRRAATDALAKGLMKDCNIKFDLRYGRLRCTVGMAVVQAIRESSHPDILRGVLLRNLLEMVGGRYFPKKMTQGLRHFLYDTGPDGGTGAEGGTYTCGGVEMRWKRIDGSFQYIFSSSSLQLATSQTWTTVQPTLDTSAGRWSPWQVYYHLYWIRLGYRRNISSLPLYTEVRMLALSDIPKDSEQWTSFLAKRDMKDRSLSRVPVIVVAGKPVALPTLGINLDSKWGNVAEEGRSSTARSDIFATERLDYFYDVRYKDLPQQFLDADDHD